MEFSPHNYQKKAISFVENEPASALFLEMGLGKTVAVLTAFNSLKYDQAEVQAMLVVAPLRVCLLTWAQEAKKWDHTQHLRTVILHGKFKKRRLHRRADVYVINYEGLKWLRDELTSNPSNCFPQKIDMVVFDESTQIKTPGAVRSKIANALALGCDRKVVLTGTPTPNNILDIWHQIYVLDGGERLGGSYSRFRGEHFFKPDEGRRYFPRRGVTKYVTKKIQDIALTMKTEDYLEMPDRIDNTVKVCLPEDLKETYDTFEQEFFLGLEEAEVVAFSAAGLSMKLRQFVQGFVYDTERETIHDIHTKKIEALREIVDGSGDPILVAIQFRYEYEMIKREFGDVPVIYGKTKTKDTVKYVEQWNRGEVPLLIAHPASMAHGINLQAGGSTIVWFGITWNLEHYLQLNARLHRQGQTRSVIVHHLVMEGTIDEAIMGAIRNKERDMNSLVKKLKEGRDGKGTTVQDAESDSQGEGYRNIPVHTVQETGVALREVYQP